MDWCEGVEGRVLSWLLPNGTLFSFSLFVVHQMELNKIKYYYNQSVRFLFSLR